MDRYTRLGLVDGGLDVTGTIGQINNGERNGTDKKRWEEMHRLDMTAINTFFKSGPTAYPAEGLPSRIDYIWSPMEAAWFLDSSKTWTGEFDRGASGQQGGHGRVSF